MAEQKDRNLKEEVVYKSTTTTGGDQLLRASSGGSSGFLYLSAFAANLILFVGGISFSWTSPVIPKLNGNVEPQFNPLPLSITPSQESWIAGLLFLGAALGPLAGGKAADCVGRKRSLQILSIPILLSYATLALSHYVQLFYVARFILGIGVGGVFSILPMYMAEISEDCNRGTIGCLMGVFVSSGLLFSFVVGPFLTVKIFSFMCIIPLIAFLVLFTLFVPESPQFLAGIGDIRGVEDALKKLRRQDSGDVQMELKQLLTNGSSEKGGLKDLFGSKGLRRGITVTLGLVVLQQLAGINVVLSYMQSIFDAAGSGMSSTLSAIIIGTVQVATTILTSLVVEKLGRKFLMIASTIGSCLSLIILGLYFHLKTKEVNLDSLSWLPVVSLMVYIVAFNLGLGPLPWAMLGELFPSTVKSVASTLTTSICFLVSFIILLFFPILTQFLGMAQSFWFFGGFCALGIVFIYLVVPETKGKSLDEIQLMLSHE